MAEQKKAYQAAMKEASSAAWDKDWARAVEAYRRAHELAPDDSQALAGLALSLMEAGRYDEALQTYQELSQLAPSDPLPYEKMAEIHASSDRPKEAAKKYLAVANLYAGRKDVAHAVPNWEHAVRLDPDLGEAHLRLVALYSKKTATHSRAIYSYLSLARLAQQFNQPARAENFLLAAQELNRTDTDVRTALDNLKQGRPIPPVDPAAFEPSARPARVHEEAATGEEEEDWGELEVEEVEGRAPADEAAHHAMSLLADLVWSGDVPPAAQTALIKAIDTHQVGDAAGAIDLYRQALDAGLDHPALRFNLGLLHQYERQHSEAIDLLSRTAEMPEYALASYLALGQVYLGEGEVRRAAGHLVEALREADRQANERLDDAGYDRLKASLSEQPLDQLTELSKGVAAYLDDPNWQAKLRDTWAGYDAQGKTSYVSDLVELVMEGGRPEMAEIMERVDLYIARDMLRMAMNEAQYAIEKAPDYLPAHRRMADILVKEGRTQEAADKVNLVANTYLIRGNAERAADLFAEVLTIWPADMVARQRVLDMLKAQERVDEALYHYTEMADLYYRLMADQDKAVEIYDEALSYAKKNDASPARTVTILKAMADIESQRLNWREALRHYSRCKDLAPDDEEVAMAMIDLNFQLGRSDEAIAALDEYMGYCIANGRIDRIVSTLEKQVRLRQNEIGLRHRLAEVYRQQGRITEAVAQMDTIGEMLLEAGHIDEAMQVIRAIIKLNPPDVEGYRELLAKLDTGA
jgi:tetratricopeptide (TPR) repeat protein